MFWGLMDGKINYEEEVFSQPQNTSAAAALAPRESCLVSPLMSLWPSIQSRVPVKGEDGVWDL